MRISVHEISKSWAEGENTVECDESFEMLDIAETFEPSNEVEMRGVALRTRSVDIVVTRCETKFTRTKCQKNKAKS
jgi:hypothetical protein